MTKIPIVIWQFVCNYIQLTPKEDASLLVFILLRKLFTDTYLFRTYHVIFVRRQIPCQTLYGDSVRERLTATLFAGAADQISANFRNRSSGAWRYSTATRKMPNKRGQ
jgi:hypothetical protein